MLSIRRGTVAAMLLLLIFSISNSRAETDYHFDMFNVFGISGQNATNRIIKIQAQSPYPGNFFYRTSSVSGDFWVSNLIAYPTIGNNYVGTILAPPSSISFSFFVESTNMGQVEAQSHTSIPANGAQTFPAGLVAPSFQAALTLFQLNGTTLSNTFYPLFSNPSNYVNTNILATSTNGFVRSDITNGLASTAYVQNATNGFVDKGITNNASTIALLNATSNTLQSQIVGGSVTAVQVTNISTNQVFLGTNTIGIASGLSAFVSTNRFDISGAGVAATNGMGISSGLSAMVSTNRFDISGAATAATNAAAISSGLSAYVSTNRFDVAGIAATKVAITNGISIGQSLTNSIIYSNSYIFLDAPNGGRFLSHQDEINQDYFYIQHDGGEFFLGITNGDNTSKNFIDFNIAGENEYVAAGGALPAHRFYVGPNASSLHPLFEIEGSIIRFDTNASFITRLYANGITLTNGTYLTTWYDNGAFLRSNSVPPYDWFSQATNGSFSIGTNTLSNFSVSSSGLTLMRTAGFATYAAASGRSNMMFVDNLGLVRTNDLGAFVDSIISGTAGGNAPITNAYGTNFPNGLITGQRLYYPTNFDALGGSNFLFGALILESNVFNANKMNSTNGSSYGQFATNLSIGGNVGLGAAGLATNILATTNVVKFVNAGTSLATNGFFIWASSQYTNWVNGAILTNNSSAWLLITNGTTLYSLSGSSPFGVYSAVSGSVPAPLGISSFILDHNGMADVGFLSPTNILAIATNSFQAATNTANSIYIPILNGSGSNTVFVWASSAGAVNFVNNGATLNFQALSAGLANTNTGSGHGAAILAGESNRIAASGATVIAGGTWNSIGGGFNNWDVIAGGLSNNIGSVDGAFIGSGGKNNLNSSYGVIAGGYANSVGPNGYSAILGGWYNTNSSPWSSVLGGASNVSSGNFSTSAGYNAKATNEYSFVWSGVASPVSSQTNSQFLIGATNGIYVNGPMWLNQLNTNGGIYILSNQFSLYAVTNSMPNFAHWIGPSNGLLVDCYYSNGTPVFKTLAP